ncbi:MAG: 50S ribosomal protein L22 [Chlorobi bacterium]|nr:50S ribosomal protein L22 [Chlorobiota bacterium]
MAEARALLRNLRISPRKVMPVADVIRNKDVNTAMELLKMVRKRASYPILKLLRSAVANWQYKHPDIPIEEAELYIKTIIVNQGPAYKRWRPVSRGRAHPYKRRTSHVLIIVDSKNEKLLQELNETQDTTK